MADINDKTANVSLTNNDESKTVTVTTDGSKERLDVNVQEPLEVNAQVTVDLDLSLTNGTLFSVTTDEQTYNITGAYSLFMIKNPVGSGKEVRIVEVIISSRGAANNTFRYFKNATVSANGTALTPINMNFTSATTAVATPFRNPTTSGGTLIYGTTSTDDKHTVSRSFFDDTSMILGEGDIFSIRTSNLKNIPVWVNAQWSEM